MRMPTLNSKEKVRFSIAIKELPLEQAQLRAGGLYWLGLDQHSDALQLLRQTLLSVDAGQRAIAVGLEDLSQALSESPVDQGPQDLRFYQMTGQPARALARLSRDLERALRPRMRLVLLMLPMDSLPADADIMHGLFKTWAAWATGNGCTLLLLAHGGQAVAHTLQLIPLNDVLSGVARVKSLAGGYQYQILHWRNELGVTGLAELALQKTDGGFVVSQQRLASEQPHTDQQRFFLERTVLEGAPVFMAAGWQAFDDRDALWERALRLNAATVVFALQDDADIEILANMLHALRKQRGLALVLVVREMRRILRGHDEQLLLACGANMVIPAGTHLSRFFSLLESVQGQQFTRELAADPARLMAGRRPVQTRGVLSPGEFVDYLDGVVERIQVDVSSGVLIALTPVPGLSAEQALTQISLRRYGDAACHVNDVVYLFLFACQPGFVEMALANVFRLPFKDMFSQHRVYSTVIEIDEQSVIIRRAWALGPKTASKTLIGPGATAPGRAIVAGQTGQPNSKLVFQPVLQPLKLETPVLCIQH